MEQGRRVRRGITSVPDRFTIRLSDADLGALDRSGELPVALASDALEWARRRGYVLASRPTVSIGRAGALRRGDIEVDARYSDIADVAAVPGAVDPARTRVFQVPAVRAPRATIIIREPGQREHTIVTVGSPLTIGRTPDNTLVLADDRVSRRHARLQARGGVLVLTDLHSTNGTRVNGGPVSEVAVGEGDVIELGDSVLLIAAMDDGHDEAGEGALPRGR